MDLNLGNTFYSMKIAKRIALLLLFIIFNHNCTQMDTKTCFDIDTFSILATLIQEKGKTILLHERLIAGENQTAKEISFEHYLIEFVSRDTASKIIVIDTERKIPAYSCKVKKGKLSFSAYESRIDSEKDAQDRKDNWCMLVTKILAE
jgi:hypothetical protein